MHWQCHNLYSCPCQICRRVYCLWYIKFLAEKNIIYQFVFEVWFLYFIFAKLLIELSLPWIFVHAVAFARLLFPYEAQLAMENASADTTSEFSSILESKVSSGNLREVDLNETPIAQNKRLLSRMEALSKTGSWYVCNPIDNSFVWASNLTLLLNYQSYVILLWSLTFLVLGYSTLKLSIALSGYNIHWNK